MADSASLMQSLIGHFSAVRGKTRSMGSGEWREAKKIPWLRFELPAARTCLDVATRCPCF